MKKTLLALTLVMFFAASAFAGDIQIPPRPIDPPPCTANCIMSEESAPADEQTPIEEAATVIRGFLWAIGDTLNLY